MFKVTRAGANALALLYYLFTNTGNMVYLPRPWSIGQIPTAERAVNKSFQED
jgi:hypothetical protein